MRQDSWMDFLKRSYDDNKMIDKSSNRNSSQYEFKFFTSSDNFSMNRSGKVVTSDTLPQKERSDTHSSNGSSSSRCRSNVSLKVGTLSQIQKNEGETKISSSLSIPQCESKREMTSESLASEASDWAIAEKNMEMASGLLNFGQPKFINSILQCLFRNNAFRNALLGFESLDPSKQSFSVDQCRSVILLNELQRFFAYMRDSRFLNFDPRNLVDSVFNSMEGKVKKDTPIDFLEFLNLLIEKIEMGWNSVNSCSEGIRQIFRGTFAPSYICSVANDPPRLRKHSFNPLILSIDKGDLLLSLEHSLRSQEKQKGMRVEWIEKAPQCLVFVINRFKLDPASNKVVKDNSRFSFPCDLIISQFLKENEEVVTRLIRNNADVNAIQHILGNDDRGKYKLRSVVLHSGPHQSGIYQTLLRHKSDWAIVDDLKQERVPEDACLRASFGDGKSIKNAVALFYEKDVKIQKSKLSGKLKSYVAKHDSQRGQKHESLLTQLRSYFESQRKDVSLSQGLNASSQIQNPLRFSKLLSQDSNEVAKTIQSTHRESSIRSEPYLPNSTPNNQKSSHQTLKTQSMIVSKLEGQEPSLILKASQVKITTDPFAQKIEEELNRISQEALMRSQQVLNSNQPTVNRAFDFVHFVMNHYESSLRERILKFVFFEIGVSKSANLPIEARSIAWGVPPIQNTNVSALISKSAGSIGLDLQRDSQIVQEVLRKFKSFLIRILMMNFSNKLVTSNPRLYLSLLDFLIREASVHSERNFFYSVLANLVHFLLSAFRLNKLVLNFPDVLKDSLVLGHAIKEKFSVGDEMIEVLEMIARVSPDFSRTLQFSPSRKPFSLSNSFLLLDQRLSEDPKAKLFLLEKTFIEKAKMIEILSFSDELIDKYQSAFFEVMSGNGMIDKNLCLLIKQTRDLSQILSKSNIAWFSI